jgi:hypothetical protein
LIVLGASGAQAEGLKLASVNARIAIDTTTSPIALSAG